MTSLRRPHMTANGGALTKSCLPWANLREHGFAALQAHAPVLDRARPARPWHRAAAPDRAAASLGLLRHPNPNPIGPGLLAFVTFWPAVILIVWGLIASLVRYRRAQAGS